MKIEIKHRFTRSIIVSGDYESVKDCLEENRGAHLRGADLRDTNLRGADLEGAHLEDAHLEGTNLRGADLEDAHLEGADLRGAHLEDAHLEGTNLRGAYLEGAKGYSQSHDIFREAVRRQSVSAFVDTEWSAIAQITIHTLCWDSIKKRFSRVMPHIFEVLAEAGFGEYLEYWNSIK